jgi:hypothetical protein
VGLLAVIHRALSWAEHLGLDRLQDGGFLGRNACPEKAMVRPGGQPVLNDGRPGVFRDGCRDERLIKASPPANLPVGFAPVEGWSKKRVKRAGMEGVDDGFLFGRDTGGREATVCPRGKAV